MAAASYLNKPWNHWHNGEWEGFYLWLDAQPDVRKDRWFWVDNASGGFWAFLLNWGHEYNEHPIFVQIESNRQSLCIKMSTEEGGPLVQPDGYRDRVRQQYHEYIMRKATEASLVHVRKPARFGTGAYMTVAVIGPEYWLGAPDQPVNFEEVKRNLNRYTAFTDDCTDCWPEPVQDSE